MGASIAHLRTTPDIDEVDDLAQANAASSWPPSEPTRVTAPAEADATSTLSATPGWRRYLWARLLSAAGSALTWIALPVLAYQLTESAMWTAVVVAFDAVPYLLLGLVAGRTADRLDRRSVIVVSDVLSGVALLSLLLGEAAGDLSPWHLAGVAFVVQSCFVFGDAAHLGGLPTLVGRDAVLAANSRLYGYVGILECVSPALAGLTMTQVSPVALLAVDGASFLVCAALIGSITAPLSPPKEVRQVATAGPALTGLRYLWTHTLLRDLTLANLLMSIGNGALFAQLVLWADDAHGITAGDVWLGILYTGLSVGGILGSFVVERLSDLGPPRAVIGLTCLVAAGSAVLGAWSPWFWAGTALLSVFSGAVFAAMIIGVSIRQSRSPEHLVGMVNTTGRMLALGIGYPLGAFGSAVIAIGTSSPALGMTVGMAVVALVWPLLLFGKDTVPEGEPADE